MARQSNAQRRREKRAEQERLRHQAERKRKIRNGSVAVAAVAFLALFAVAIWPTPDEGNTTAQAWDLPELDGDGRIALSDFTATGKPTVLAFFASWCTECEIEIPEYLALSRQIGDEVNFVGVNTQDNGAGMGDAEKWGIAGEWPLARDIGNGNGSSLSSATFGARGMPLTVVYDEVGSVAQVIPGRISSQQLIDILDELTSYEA